MKNLQMVDLQTQYQRIKPQVDAAILECVESAAFINGPQVKAFGQHLAQFLDVKHVIPCANGTDALQIAMMALGLEPDDEVIVPAFTYVATAEVIALLRLRPIMVDVDPDTFNVRLSDIEAAISPRTRAIVPVHLFGQVANMEEILNFAKKYNLFVIEDNAQAIGATYTFSDGTQQKAGTMGDVGCTSFFPSKNLGCYGDGGAIFTNSDDLAAKIRMVANHGQVVRYYHEVVGVNSRLDSIQAAVLDIKLAQLDQYNASRERAARAYDAAFSDIADLQIPTRSANSTHVFHQYTLKVLNGKRDELHQFLLEKGIPNAVYYPVPLYEQRAFAAYWGGGILPNTDALCRQVISLPMHTELTAEILNYITTTVKSFFQ